MGMTTENLNEKSVVKGSKLTLNTEIGEYSVSSEVGGYDGAIGLCKELLSPLLNVIGISKEELIKELISLDNPELEKEPE